jgi:SHS2 domain-containing protein
MDLSATGPTLPDAFARIALALFAAAVDPASVDETEVREVRAHGPDPEALLRRWLDECLYIHEVEGFACRSIEFTVFETAAAAGAEPLRLHALLRGEPIEPNRHAMRAVIRRIGAQSLSVQGESEGFQARATVDLSCC